MVFLGLEKVFNVLIKETKVMFSVRGRYASHCFEDNGSSSLWRGLPSKATEWN